MRTLLLWLCGILFAAALVALVLLVLPDFWIGFQPSMCAISERVHWRLYLRAFHFSA
jgi:hypothetical protein